MSTDVSSVPQIVDVIPARDGTADVVNTGGVDVVTGPDGPPGTPAKVSVSFYATGPFTAHALIAAFIMAGAGMFDATHSHAAALVGLTGTNSWKVTINGTFASPTQATNTEIANALFATIAFPTGTGAATWTIPSGAFVDGDILRVWESASPDATQGSTMVTLAGA